MSFPGATFTKNDYVYAQLRTRILTGELEAGSVIGQARLASELGVSTTPLREAIRRLAAEGMIDLEAHRDARVTEVTADEARHLYQVRESLDPLATSLAARNRTGADLSVCGRERNRCLGGGSTLVQHRCERRSRPRWRDGYRLARRQLVAVADLQR